MPPAVPDVREKQSIIVEASYQISGKYPDVPITPDVNVEELTAYDREAGCEPFFIVLPLGEVGQVSQNRRRYVGDVAVRAIFKAITEQRIGGNKGHTPNLERDTFFDVPVLHWVGALIDEKGIVWGKAYVPADSERMREMRGYYKRQMATNGRVGTSIEGVGYQEFNSQDEIYDITELEVYRIDVVEALQVGVKRAGTMPPMITSEKADATDLQEAAPNELRVGDFVQWERDGALAIGEINTISTEGEVEIPYTDGLTITATAEDPVARMYGWYPNWQGKGWIRSDGQTVQHVSKLTKSKPVQAAEKQEKSEALEEKENPMADKPIEGEKLTELQEAQASLAELQTQLAEAKAQAAVLASIAEALGGTEKPLDAVKALLGEVAAVREEAKKLMVTAVEQAIDSEAKIVAEALGSAQPAVQGFGKTVRGMIAAMVAQEAISKKDDIAPAIKRVFERDDVKNLLESTRVLVMGPNVETPFEEHQEGDASLEAVTYS